MLEDLVVHLEELRRRLFVWLFAFLAAAVISYFFSSSLLHFLTRPLSQIQDARLFFQAPYDAFVVSVKVALLSGVIISSPVFFTQAWLFIIPGLYEKEKKIVFSLISASIALFLAGAAFAYYVIVPVGLRFLLSFQSDSLRPLLAVGPYFSFLSGMILAFGLLFDFPVVIFGLVRSGVLQTETLAQARKPLIVLIFVAAAILTPSPDPVSQILLAVPLLLLFEISLGFARFVERRAKIDTP